MKEFHISYNGYSIDFMSNYWKWLTKKFIGPSLLNLALVTEQRYSIEGNGIDTVRTIKEDLHSKYDGIIIVTSGSLSETQQLELSYGRRKDIPVWVVDLAYCKGEFILDMCGECSISRYHCNAAHSKCTGNLFDTLKEICNGCDD